MLGCLNLLVGHKMYYFVCVCVLFRQITSTILQLAICIYVCWLICHYVKIISQNVNIAKTKKFKSLGLVRLCCFG